MDSRIAKNAIAFLQRATLNGSEAPAFMEVVGALGAIATEPAQAAPAAFDRMPSDEPPVDQKEG